MDDLLSGDQRNLQSYQSARTVLGDSVPIVVSLDCGEVFTPEGIDLIREVTVALANIPGGTTSTTNILSGEKHVWVQTNVISLVMNMARPVVTKKFPIPNMEWVDLVPQELDTVSMAELRRWSQEHPFARNFLVAEDGQHTVLLVNYNRLLETAGQQVQFHRQLEAALQPFRDKGHSVRAIGLPLIEHEIRSTVTRDVQRFLPTALVVLLVVLSITFWRAPRLMIYILLNQVLGIMLLPALFQLTGLRLNIFTILLIPLLTGVHLTLLTHIGTSFQRAWVAGRNGMASVRVMWGEVFRASGFAALTTAIGLLALLASDVEQLQEFGLLGAAGLAMLFALTFGPGLALLPLFFGQLAVSTEKKTSSILSLGWMNWVRTRIDLPGCLFICAVIIALGISLVRTDVRASEFLNTNSPTRRMIEEMDAAYGGINMVQLAVDSGKTNGINHPQFLNFLDELHREAAKDSGVTAVYSYAQLLAVINEVWEGGEEGVRHLPESPYTIALFTGIIRSQTAQLPFLRTLCDTNYQTAQLTLRTRDMPSEEYLDLLRRLEVRAREKAPEGVNVSANSGIRDILEADQRVVRSQRKSVFWSMGLIGLVLTMLWRSLTLAVLALVVNLLPVGLLIALQGFVGVPLNSVTIMVAAIALGIAVDDTIHFITHWRDEMAGGASAIEAARRAMMVKGRPIVATTAILVGMVAVFWVSSFPPVVHFGLLLAVGLSGALATVLVLLPAWLCRQASK
ncbi:MAG: MMPL family transporter [Verrucomicrobiota bacterium]|nr:MMPL family transporter [Verrucomicrobiota bacterium]